MATFIWTCAAFALGFFSYLGYWKIRHIVSQRINHGKPVLLDGEKIGSVISLRYDGSKRYIFMDYDYCLNTDNRYYTADDATMAVKQAYVAIMNKRARDNQKAAYSRTF